eukprot:scaffold15035_cov119-Isochrysis_galbana.AAC.3
MDDASWASCACAAPAVLKGLGAPALAPARTGRCGTPRRSAAFQPQPPPPQRLPWSQRPRTLRPESPCRRRRRRRKCVHRLHSPPRLAVHAASGLRRPRWECGRAERGRRSGTRRGRPPAPARERAGVWARAAGRDGGVWGSAASRGRRAGEGAAPAVTLCCAHPISPAAVMQRARDARGARRRASQREQPHASRQPHAAPAAPRAPYGRPRAPDTQAVTR